MLYNILKPLHVTIDGEHHDTLRQDYPGCFSYFANFYGTVRWRDTTTPRTDAPVRFVAHAARPDYRTFRGVSGLSSPVVRLHS